MRLPSAPLLLSPLSIISDETVDMDPPAFSASSSAFAPELPSAPDLPAPASDPEIAPFYDPVDDEHNEEWALMQRQGRKSDAVLSCPACFTILCIDCQRHEFYVNQYRAMFVRNCTIVETESLRYSDTRKRKRKAGRKSQLSVEECRVGRPGMVRVEPKDVGVDEDVLKPVKCAECGAQVAVLDSDELYHFFDIIPTFS
ncbi:uncharacterized protein [Physcomitrium patens]|uniref:E2F-associated phosphoprotein n=1 Tax=Physcomitrium patens TaxID=3218 RepID=A0A2K1JN68_PHYPA|nr:E2F-associated phosphoprotein-like isoform X2 [Physcomitrium patens]PNR42978.1 hypothetical protein PHYPA_017810 [Physcomitrium patens]|eukprot:XP_024392910.1 E2F-associated phosphoprotein-like isoform X2 [Physcomitrella patens]